MSHQLFVHSHRVTYAECTMGNHIYYSRYLDLLEAARGEFFRHLGMPFKQLHEDDTLFPVVEVQVRYKGAARYDDVLRVELWLTEMERVRLGFAYRIINEAQHPIIAARTLHACTTAEDRMKKLPVELVAQLSPYLAASSET
jgi:acyl-CoA thioester hydrolase